MAYRQARASLGFICSYYIRSYGFCVPARIAEHGCVDPCDPTQGVRYSEGFKSARIEILKVTNLHIKCQVLQGFTQREGSQREHYSQVDYICFCFFLLPLIYS
jgi:hypothetical protein